MTWKEIILKLYLHKGNELPRCATRVCVCACVCVCVHLCVVPCQRVTKLTQRARNEEQGNAVNEIIFFLQRNPARGAVLFHFFIFFIFFRLIKKAIPPPPELSHSLVALALPRLINDPDDNGEGRVRERCAYAGCLYVGVI